MGRYAVVMAGGRGERLWPWSRSKKPKQFLPLAGEEALLRQTVNRLLKLMPPENIIIAAGIHLAEPLAEILPDIPWDNMLLEPVGRNTLPCVGLAALKIIGKDPEASMLVVPSDQAVAPDELYVETLERALTAAEEADYISLIGIVPTRPESGYGYIKATEQAPDFSQGNLVDRFVEKPTVEKAQQMLDEGDFYWNSGIFAWSCRRLLKEIAEFQPELKKILDQLMPKISQEGQAEALAELFPECPSISVDYGILEKTDRLLVIPGRFAWDDLGSWASVRERSPYIPGDSNRVRGKHIGVATENCHVVAGDQLVATLGLKDVTIVCHDGVVLVMADAAASRIRELVEKVRGEGHVELL